MSLAVVVIASEKRKDTTWPEVMKSVIAQRNVEEIVCVADFPYEEPYAPAQWQHHVVEPMLRNTVDALVKRDVGWLVTASDYVCFLCDDHRLSADFGFQFAVRYEDVPPASITVPSRYCLRDGESVWLNVGKDHMYAGGHCAIYHRSCATLLPWSAGPHHPNWDVLHTHALMSKGASLRYAENDLSVEDIEGGQPWN